MNVDIQYDRRARQYTWIEPESGEVFTFPAKAKGDAYKFAVSMLDPDLYTAAQRMIARHPQLERVAWKAVELVAGGGVENYAPPKGNVLAMVDSSDGLGRYAIQVEDGYTSCQCEHFASFAAPVTDSGSRICKHIAAYHLYLLVREERY
ncbi:MAG: hypothetical protein KF770_10605 [Anaerolineae bacterium]|nr:hypothetical protein [Anaerolineae bacterium]